jgi:hypothetical protein
MFDMPMQPYPAGGWTTLRLPLSVSGIPDSLESHYEVQALEMTAPGNRTETLHPSYVGPDWLILEIRKPLYDCLKDARVELKGTVVVALHRFAPSASIPVGANRPVASAGRCSSGIIDIAPFGAALGVMGNRLRALNVSCESSAGFALEPTVRVLKPAEPSAPSERLLASSNPWPVSLSPIERVHGYTVRQDASTLSSARIEITPDIPCGSQVVNMDLRGIRLSDYAF